MRNDLTAYIYGLYWEMSAKSGNTGIGNELVNEMKDWLDYSKDCGPEEYAYVRDEVDRIIELFRLGE